MTGTHLFYNGVLLRDCELQQWRQEIVRDESNTDVLYSKFTLSVESTLVSLLEPSDTPGQVSITPYGGIAAPVSTVAVPRVPSENVVDRYHEVRARLQETRKDFWFALHGVTKYAPNVHPDSTYANNASYRVVLAATGLSTTDLWTLNNNPDASIGRISAWSDFGIDGSPSLQIERRGVIDLNNGPRPLTADVTQVFGGRSLRVRFTIEVCRCFCRPLSSGQQANEQIPPVLDAARAAGVLSNRWSLTETMDEKNRTTHQIEGKLVVSDIRYKPHAMRLLVTPRLFPYAKMVNRTFSSDKTGLILGYAFAIKEAGAAAPAGVAEWSGRYTEQQASGGKNLATISVRVVGAPNPSADGFDLQDPNEPLRAQKRHLLSVADRLVRSRIRWQKGLETLPGSTPANITLVDIAVTEDMRDPVIEIQASFLYADAPTAGGLVSDRMGLRLQNMGRSFASDMADILPNYNPKRWPAPDPFPWDVTTENADALAQGADGGGSYYDCYFQTPCSLWHGMPQGAVPPELVARDGVPEVTTRVSYDPSLTAADIGRPLPPWQNWWNVNQAQFTYYQADIDTRYTVSSGKVQLPLSKPRLYTGQTSITLRLHAGLAQRHITMVATREGKWPEVPAPQAVVFNGDIREEYLDGEIVADTPKLGKDGKTFYYSLQIHWVYSMSRMPNMVSDKLFAAASPMTKREPGDNVIFLSSYFTRGNIEYATGGESSPNFG